MVEHSLCQQLHKAITFFLQLVLYLPVCFTWFHTFLCSCHGRTCFVTKAVTRNWKHIANGTDQHTGSRFFFSHLICPWGVCAQFLYCFTGICDLSYLSYAKNHADGIYSSYWDLCSVSYFLLLSFGFFFSHPPNSQTRDTTGLWSYVVSVECFDRVESQRSVLNGGRTDLVKGDGC